MRYIAVPLEHDGDTRFLAEPVRKRTLIVVSRQRECSWL